MSVRTILDFNSEYAYKCWLAEEEEAVKPKKSNPVRSMIFYSFLIAMVLFAFIYSGQEGGGKKFGPLAYNVVLSGSMSPVYEKGALVVSWAVKPNEPLAAGLDSGDDIVFVLEDDRVVVHRIIETFEDYEDSGQRGFRTQGVDNPEPDNWVVYENNVIGQVIWQAPYLGDILALIAENFMIVIAAIIGLFILFTLLRTVFAKEEMGGV